MKKRTWYRLDNAGKIYPPTSNERRGGMFSLSATLKEKIDPETLTDAVNVVLERFPTFKVKLRKGLFWYYLEENKKPFIVNEEPPYFMQFIGAAQNTNDYLFNVFYLDKKINLVMFHALTDGTGGMELLKAIIFEYLVLKGHKIKSKGLLKTIYSPATLDECTDKFLQVYEKKNNVKLQKEYNAYRLNGTPFNVFGTGMIRGTFKVSQIKALSKKYNATITGFIAGLVMHSIYKNYIENKNVKNQNVKLLIPVNMRKFYKSDTIRNFALFARVGTDFKHNGALNLEECIKVCNDQIKEQTKKDVLDTVIASHVKSEKNWALKLAPLFIKDVAMQIAYALVGDNLHTTSFSNLGIVKLPESVSKHVENIDFALGTSYSAKYTLAAISYNDYLTITFSREFVETYLEKDFFNFLTQNGVDVTLSSNYWEDKKWNTVKTVTLK